jgi:hypothetical protein
LNAAALYLLDAADGTVTEVAVPDDPGADVRLYGWTPDGQRFVYGRGALGIPYRTHVLDMTSDEKVVIDAAFAHVSTAAGSSDSTIKAACAWRVSTVGRAIRSVSPPRHMKV